VLEQDVGNSGITAFQTHSEHQVGVMLGERLIHVRACNLHRQFGGEQLCDLRRQVLAPECLGKLRPAHELLEEGIVVVSWWIRHKSKSYAGLKSKTNRAEGGFCQLAQVFAR